MPTNTEMSAFQERLNTLGSEIVRLSVSDSSLEEYFRNFLERVVAVLGVGGAVWSVNELGTLESLCHMNLDKAGLQDNDQQKQMLQNALQKVMQTSESIVLPSQGASNVFDGGLAEAGVNDSPHTLLFVPISPMDKVEAIMLLIAPTEVDPRAVRGFLGFLQGLCERAGVFLQRDQIKDMQRQIAQSDRLRQFISSLHSGLDTRRAGYALANYAQELLGVYRCMVGTFSYRGKFNMEAVSGVESLAVKSSFIRDISEIARQVCRNDKLLMVDNPNAAIKDDVGESDDLLTAARLYMLQGRSLVMGVFPIRCDGRVVGALIVEKATEQEIDQAHRRRIEGLLTEAGSALANCLNYRHLPLSPLVRAVAALRQKVYLMPQVRRAIWATILVLAVLAPLLIRGQVKVIGTAELVPIDARIAYVEQDGVIETVSVQAGQDVRKGDVLSVLDKRIIESEIDRVTDHIGKASLGFRNAQGSGQTAMAQQYHHELKALEAEKKKYTLQLEQYEIKAPVDGVVITSQSRIRQLLSRPVGRGEPVLEIVPHESDWQLLVNVAENTAGELLKAYDRLEPGRFLEAKIILNAYPDKTFRTKVLSVARRAHVLSTGQQKYRNVIEVRVEGPAELKDNIEPRQGMEGKVAIECGKRSLYYVVTHEFIDFVRVSMF
jgi:multidrug resistance efflux pump